MKVYKTPAGEHGLILQEGTDDFRLFQNFLATTGKNLPDTRLKMLFEKMQSAYQNAENKTDAPATPANVVSQGYSTQTNQKLDVISQKIDSVIRAIGGIGNINPAAAKIDLSALEGAIARMEKTIGNQLVVKMEALTEGVSFNNLCVDIKDIVKKEVAEIKSTVQQLSAYHKQIDAINNIDIGSTQLLPSATQVESIVTQAAADEYKATKRAIEEARTEHASVDEIKKEDEDKTLPRLNPGESVDKVTMEDFTNPAEDEAVVQEDIIRYPARKKKNTRPKCYGNFDSTDESPCRSCAWVNDCSLNEPVKETNKPGCYGQYKADLRCGSCPESNGCMNDSM